MGLAWPCPRKDRQPEGRLTFLKGREEHLEATVAAALVSPQADHAQTRAQHDVIGHRAAELGLQVLYRAAAVVHGHEVPFALVGVLHLVVQESQVDLQQARERSSPRIKRGQPLSQCRKSLLLSLTSPS